MKFRKFPKAFTLKKVLINVKGGFTLIELLIVIGIVTTLTSLTVVNLIKPQTQATFSSALNVMSSDIKSQQLKAMTGESLGQPASLEHGIYFEANKYTLFKGSTYSASDPENFVVNLENDITLTGITLPNSQVVFSKRSGNVSNFVDGSNTLTINNTQSGESKTLTIQRYGAVFIN